MPNAIPYGYCHCSCGQRTALAPASRQPSAKFPHGAVKGEPYRYVYGHSHRGRTFKHYGLRRAKPLTVGERLHWANLRIADALRLANANPGDRAYAEALASRRAEWRATARAAERRASA